MKRAGDPILSCSVLHHMGFFVPPRLRLGRWALTPPFHPYRNACAHRRFVFCDTFRQPQLSPRFPACSPRHAALWCPDFPLHAALRHTLSDRPPSMGKVVNARGCARRQFREAIALKQFGDLNRIESGSFEQLISANPESESIFHRAIETKTAGKTIVFSGGIQRHRITIGEKLKTWGL